MIGILNKKILISLIIMLVALGSLAVWFVYKYKQAENQTEISLRQNQKINQELDNLLSKQQVATTTATTESKLKTYRNEEFGFEFQYPNDWKIEENTSRSPFSKFNLIAFPLGDDYLPDPFLINIATPDFADRAVISRKNLGANVSDIIVSGVKGIKYEYIFEDLPTISVDLPFGEHRMILGAKKQYEEIFNQILASFKFIK